MYSATKLMWSGRIKWISAVWLLGQLVNDSEIVPVYWSEMMMIRMMVVYDHEWSVEEFSYFNEKN